MWTLKYNINEFIYKTKRLTDTENKHGYRAGRGRRDKVGAWD